jgi:hypothetical protein
VQVLLGEEDVAVGAGIDRAEQLIEPRSVSPKGLDLVRECPPRTQRPQRPSRGKSSFAAIEIELFGGTKIGSLDPPLTAVCTAYPTEPLLTFFDPSSCPPLDQVAVSAHFPAIRFGTLLYVSAGEVHI